MARMKKPLSEQVREHSRKKEVEEPANISLLPTGSTLLNLYLSDNPYGGYGAGKMVHIVGDSSSGKSFLALTCFAALASNPRFKDYRFIYDDVENASEFNLGRLFGSSVEDRVEAPAVDEEGDNKPSNTIQEFQMHIYEALKEGRPFIYILDSFDALTEAGELEKAEERIEAMKKGKEVSGSYGMAKAKMAGEILRQIVGKIRKSNSLLIIISQTRDNIDPMSFQKKTHSGGKALKFYATHQFWMAVGDKKKSKDHVIGVETVIKVTKNKLTGKQFREITFPIYYDYGIDDIGSMIDWMVEHKFWTKGGKISAPEMDFEGTREKFIREIEENNREKELIRLISKKYRELEDSLKLNRKPRFEQREEEEEAE